MPVFSDSSGLKTWLDSVPMFGAVGMAAANFSLEAITKAVSLAGNPQRSFKSIHVAGTNGKGTVCSALASVYTTAGYTTGLYTSPHLLRVNERFRIDGREATDEDLLRIFNRIGPVLDSVSLTYFEMTTLFAFVWFAEQEVDLAIIETGLGGRLDATNCLEPLAAVITSIGMDHADVLGATKEQIAREKAGIIKPGGMAVVGETDPALRPVFSQKTESVIFLPERPPVTFESDLYGPRVQKNLHIAAATIHHLQPVMPVGSSDTAEGFRTIAKNTGLKARFERMHPEKNWFFDGAHNEDAIRALIRFVDERWADQPVHYVFSLMKDKCTETVLTLVKGLPHVYYAALNTPRAMKFEEISEKIPHIRQFDKKNAYFDSEVVIFCGSFYFYGYVIDWITSE